MKISFRNEEEVKTFSDERQPRAFITRRPTIKEMGGFPWWRSGWESACQCRGHRSEPWSGKIPHAAERLGLWAMATEPVRLEPMLCNKRGRDSERPAHHDEEWPPLAATRESPRTETKTQHSQKLINYLIKKKKEMGKEVL